MQFLTHDYRLNGGVIRKKADEGEGSWTGAFSSVGWTWFPDYWISKHHIYRDVLNIMYVYAWVPRGQKKLERVMICRAKWMDGLQRELTFGSASSSSLLIFRSSSNILRREKCYCSPDLLSAQIRSDMASRDHLFSLMNLSGKRVYYTAFMLGNEEVDSGWSTSLLRTDQMFSF